MTDLITLGPIGQEVTLSDITKYIINPRTLKVAKEYQTVYQPLMGGGVRVAYRVLRRLTYDFELIIRGDNSDYDTAIKNYWDLTEWPDQSAGMGLVAAAYWETFNLDPNPNPPVYFSEQFFNQATPTVWLVTAIQADEPNRELIQAASINTHVKLDLTPVS